VNAQLPISIFLTGASGEMSKSKMSIGSPSVMHAFGIYRVFFSLGFQRKGELNQGPTYVDQPGDMPLDGCTAKEEVDLVVVVAYQRGSAHASYRTDII
jgi:hypothetical protein